MLIKVGEMKTSSVAVYVLVDVSISPFRFLSASVDREAFVR